MTDLKIPQSNGVLTKRKHTPVIPPLSIPVFSTKSSKESSYNPFEHFDTEPCELLQASISASSTEQSNKLRNQMKHRRQRRKSISADLDNEQCKALHESINKSQTCRNLRKQQEKEARQQLYKDFSASSVPYKSEQENYFCKDVMSSESEQNVSCSETSELNINQQSEQALFEKEQQLQAELAQIQHTQDEQEKEISQYISVIKDKAMELKREVGKGNSMTRKSWQTSPQKCQGCIDLGKMIKSMERRMKKLEHKLKKNQK